MSACVLNKRDWVRTSPQVTSTFKFTIFFGDPDNVCFYTFLVVTDYSRPNLTLPDRSGKYSMPEMPSETPIKGTFVSRYQLQASNLLTYEKKRRNKGLAGNFGPGSMSGYRFVFLC